MVEMKAAKRSQRDPEAAQVILRLLEKWGSWTALERRLKVNRGLLWAVVNNGTVSVKVRQALGLETNPGQWAVSCDGSGRPQRLEFNPAAAESRKKAGMEAAKRMRPRIVALARDIAKLEAQRNPERKVTIDQVMEGLEGHGYGPEDLGRAAGSVFKTKDWRCVGQTKSTRVTNNGRRILVWRYVGP